MGIFLKWLTSSLVISHWILVIPLIAAGAILYGVLLMVIMPKKLITEINSVKKIFL